MVYRMLQGLPMSSIYTLVAISVLSENVVTWIDIPR